MNAPEPTTEGSRRTLTTLHGELSLPTFLPDATRAAVRCCDSADLYSVGVEALAVNCFHLANRPGVGAVSAVGGIHAFMNWKRPIMSDSGGFQVFSLLRDSPRLGSVTRKGFAYRTSSASNKRLLTPQKCVRNQIKLGADIVVCLDYCTHPDAPAQEQSKSVDYTLSWAVSCRDEFDRLTAEGRHKPLLFAVIQGGDDESLRRQGAEGLAEIGFDGYGFGGWPVSDSGRLREMVCRVATLIPTGAIRWAAGIGKPELIAECAACGYDLFDCSMPTRDARHGRLYAFSQPPESLQHFGAHDYRRVYVMDDEFVRAGGPIDETCDCPCCRSYSLAYVNHLFRVRDPLGFRLATIHNLRFYNRLLVHLRSSLESRDTPEH